MQLSFRGAKYELSSLGLGTSAGEVGGKYRGLPWKVHRFRPNFRRRPPALKLSFEAKNDETNLSWH